jgi:hypothetical protein
VTAASTNATTSGTIAITQGSGRFSAVAGAVGSVNRVGWSGRANRGGRV